MVLIDDDIIPYINHDPEGLDGNAVYYDEEDEECLWQESGIVVQRYARPALIISFLSCIVWLASLRLPCCPSFQLFLLLLSQLSPGWQRLFERIPRELRD